MCTRVWFSMQFSGSADLFLPSGGRVKEQLYQKTQAGNCYQHESCQYRRGKVWKGEKAIESFKMVKIALL